MSSSALVRTQTVRSHVHLSVGLPQSRGIRIGSWSSYVYVARQTSTQNQLRLAKHKEVEVQAVLLAWERQPFLSPQWGRKSLHMTASVRAPKRSDDDDPTDGAVLPNEPYVIDPITNRKVFASKGPKKSAQFLGHIAGFSKMAPPNNTDPKVVHLDGLSPASKDKPSTTDSGKQKSYLAGVIEDGIASVTGSFQNTSFDHDKTTTYAPYHADEPDGKYKDLQSSAPSNPGLKEYDSTHDYNAGVRAHEPDGLYKVLQANKEKPEAWTEFDEKTSYDGAFRSHEPDGLYKVLQANKDRPEGWTEFDEKTAYDRGFRSHEPDGLYKKMQSEIPVIPGLSDHDSKIAYDAFRAHEPDGKYKEMQAKMPVIPGLSDHDSKIAYGAVRAYEPDGKYKALHNKKSSVSGLGDHDNNVAYDKPFQAHEPDGIYQQKQKTERSVGELGEFDAKANYQTPYKSHEPDGKYKAMQKQGNSKQSSSDFGEFDAKSDYTRPVRSHEPDGMYKSRHTSASDRKGLDEYEVDQDYTKAVKAHEPDGMYKPLQTSEAARNGLDEFEKKHPGYDKPVRAHEPDGMYKPLQSFQNSQDELDYDRKQSYKEGVRAHEPDGMYKPLQTSEAVRKGLDEFEKKHPGYDKPVRAHEPDGMYKLAQEKTSSGNRSDFDAKNPYGPVFSDEPDGKYKKNQYVTFQSPDPNGKPVDKSKPTIENKRSWLDQEGFCERSAFARVAGMPSSLFKKGGAIESSLSGVAGRFATRSKLSKFDLDDADKTEDLDLLRASDIRARSGILKGARKETDAEKAAKRQALTADFESTTSIDGITSDRQDDTSSIKSDLNSVDPGEKSNQRQVNGNYARFFPEDRGWASLPKGASVPSTESSSNDAISESLAQDHAQEQKIDRTILTNDPNSRSGSSSRLQSSMGRQKARTANSTSDQSENNNAASAKPPPKDLQHLETLNAKELGQQGESDLPVFESSSSGRDQNSAGFVAERRAKLETKREQTDLVRKLRGIYEDTYGTINLQHRQPTSSQVSPDLSASLKEKEKEKEELGKSFEALPAFSPESEEKLREEIREGQYFINDCYMDIAKIHARRASEAPSTSETPLASASLPGMAPPATSYKILAYDPTMQTINTAATTSMVPDSNPTLTPAEVLLRLSNPSKFFPHFAPLQAEGYEIVSGLGDVLVFRKVREASPVISKTAKQAKTIRTNPIDGTQGTPQPATGNFASPTGFVNHDLHDQVEERTPFISGISMRREEPVFSGQQRTWSDASNDRTKNRTKRGRKLAKRVFLSAGILAGSTYAAGVVIEFFRSGGSDGLGTVGF